MLSLANQPRPANTAPGLRPAMRYTFAISRRILGSGWSSIGARRIAPLSWLLDLTQPAA